MILPTGGQRQSKEKGFSLLELILVILIMGLLISAVSPRISGSFSDLQLRRSGEDMVSLFVYTRERATKEQTLYQLYLDQEKGKYWLAMPQTSPGEESDFIPVYSPGGKIHRLTGHVFFQTVVFRQREETADNRWINFYPDGRVEMVEICLVNDRGRRFSLWTEGVTGQVKWQMQGIR